MNNKKRVLRWIPLAIIVLALAAAIYFKVYEYFTFSMLEKHYQAIEQWKNQHYLLSVVIYIVIYIVMVAVSIPGATILTITGGFLFGVVLATIYVVISATIGATLLFIAVETSLGAWLANKAETWARNAGRNESSSLFQRMEVGFQKNAFNYMLFLRLVPIFPFWIINIVPALLNIRLRSFVFATLFGIIPGSFVYVLVGNGLSSVLAAGEAPDLGVIFRPAILAPLLGLAVLSLVPIIYKKVKAKND